MKKKKTLIIGAIILAVVLLVGFFALYQYSIKPMNTVVLQVGDMKTNMNYFLKRIMMSVDQQSLPTLQTIMNEQVILLGSQQEPFNISVTDEEVDAHAKSLAVGDGDISDGEFKEWYRQQVNESGLSSAEYKEIVKVSLLTQKMLEYFRGELSKGIEHVNLNVIMLDDAALYDAIQQRYTDGESFGALAAEYSCDSDLAESAGKYDWVAKGELDDDLDQVIFSLDVGQLSDLTTLDSGAYAVFMVSEKDGDREPSSESLQILEEEALSDWIESAYSTYDVELYGFHGAGYDSETDAWVNWQISKMQEREGDSESETEQQESE